MSQVGQRFKALTVGVWCDGVSAHRLEDNVDSALESVESGEHELQRYWRNLSSGRLLTAKIAGVVFLFFLFFLFFLA